MKATVAFTGVTVCYAWANAILSMGLVRFSAEDWLTGSSSS